MNKIAFRKFLGCVCLVFLVAGVGCRKRNEGTSGPANIESAYKGTRPEVKEFADQAVAAEEKKDFGTAFVHYRALSLNPDLTSEQRNLANDSMLAMNKKLREAATNGDPDAKKILEMYHATK